jgi:Family of unknown function (DUF5681)
MSRPLSHGRSGNPKGRPKRKGEGLPYARILDRMVTIKDGRGARQVTAEEAFLLYLRKKALDGNEARNGWKRSRPFGASATPISVPEVLQRSLE